MGKQFAVIGLSTFGEAVALELMCLGHSVLGVDSSEERASRLADSLTQAVIADIAVEISLRELDLPRFDAVLVAVEEDVEASVLCTLAVVSLGSREVWVRVLSDPTAESSSSWVPTAYCTPKWRWAYAWRAPWPPARHRESLGFRSLHPRRTAGRTAGRVAAAVVLQPAGGTRRQIPTADRFGHAAAVATGVQSPGTQPPQGAVYRLLGGNCHWADGGGYRQRPDPVRPSDSAGVDSPGWPGVWVPAMGFWRGLWCSFFHAASAFNKAGFALWSGSLVRWASHPMVMPVISGLFIVGGLGFTVLVDLWRRRNLSGLNLHSKLTLSGTAILALGAWLLVMLFSGVTPTPSVRWTAASAPLQPGSPR